MDESKKSMILINISKLKPINSYYINEVLHEEYEIFIGKYKVIYNIGDDDFPKIEKRREENKNQLQISGLFSAPLARP